MEEILDIFDKNENHIGTKTRTLCHKDDAGVFHHHVLVWIINNKHEILVQKRAPSKTKSPNKWDISASGHVASGESFIEGCVRETFEELGILAIQKEFLFLGNFRNNKTWSFSKIYLLKTNFKTSQMKLQKEEVSEVKYLNLKDFTNLFYSNDFYPYDLKYKDYVFKILQKFLY